MLKLVRVKLNQMSTHEKGIWFYATDLPTKYCMFGLIAFQRFFFVSSLPAKLRKIRVRTIKMMNWFRVLYKIYEVTHATHIWLSRQGRSMCFYGTVFRNELLFARGPAKGKQYAATETGKPNSPRYSDQRYLAVPCSFSCPEHLSLRLSSKATRNEDSSVF